MPGILVRSSILAVVLAGSLFALDPAKSLTQYAHPMGGREEGLFQPAVFSIAQTRWWFVPVVAAIILVAIALYRMRIRRLQKNFELVLAERTRIARELHDALLQGLSGVTMQLQALWSRLPASPEKQMLGAIIGDAGRCCSEARRSVWDLRNDTEPSRTLSAKLAKLARDAVAGSGISLKLELEPLVLQLAPEVEHELLRIAREAIANVLLHARASRLTVSGAAAAGRLRIVVEDNGVGFAAPGVRNRAGHFGLEGMKERASGIGAELEIGASPDGGTRIALGLPLGRGRETMGNPKDALARPSS